MTQDEIIEMARQAGMEVHSSKGQIRIGSAVFTGDDTTKQVEAFAKLVAAKERQECKKECLEQFELSLTANEKAKRVKDKEAYLNSAIGAKYCLMRIEARGEA